MNDRCGCDRLESAHHHAFGGTYPCEGPELCIQCQPLETRPVFTSSSTAVNNTGRPERVVSRYAK